MREVWVDAMGPAGGDGTAEHPARELPALAPGMRVHLKSGLYRGPFVLPPKVELTGEGQAVLYVEGGEGAVVSAPSGGKLTRLSVQGGGVGVLAAGAVELEQVHFSGHRQAALLMAEGQLSARQCEVEATVPNTRGFVLGSPERYREQLGPPDESDKPNGGHEVRGAEGVRLAARVSGSHFFGAFDHAIDAAVVALELADTTLDGASSPLRIRGGEATLTGLTVRGGRGPAVFAAGAALKVSGLKVVGHEYGLQARASRVEVDGVDVRLSEHAGVALVECTGELQHLTFEKPGNFAAVQLLASKLRVTHVEVRDAAAAGVVVRQGEVTLEDVRVRGVSAEAGGTRGDSGGDALMLRGCRCRVKGLDVEDAGGTAVWVSTAAVVDLDHVVCRRCEVGALVVELAARVTAREVEADGAHGPAVSVLEHGLLELSGLKVSGVQVPVWAECNKGAAARVSGIEGAEQPSSDCLALRP